jgi:pimeloyl-ACP methyl ester carboxylesterase
MLSEVLHARTSDGWSLAVHHLPGKGERRRWPVLMVHGLGANRLHFDLDDRYSVARAARMRGFDVYVLELRGVGMSKAPEGWRGAWGFNDFADRDLPAAVDLVLRHSKREQLHAFGHSMGGMLFYRYAVTRPGTLRSITAVASPLACELELGPVERRLIQLVLRLVPNEMSAKVPFRILMGAAAMSGIVPFASKFADVVLLNADNTEVAVMDRMAREAITDIPLQLLVELTQQMASKAPEGGPYAYEQQLHRINVPTFALGGAVDRIAPPASVKAAAARLTAPDVRYREMGLRHGDRADYGHVDLLVGKSAPEEVFPLCVDFLEEMDTPAMATQKRRSTG